MSFATRMRDLEQKFAAVAAVDGDVYLPNFTPSGPVDAVLIGMEPSLGWWAHTPAEAAQKIAAGFRNFMWSPEDFILHYAARRFLCSADETYRSDRTGVLGEWHGDHPPILDRLPLNYDDTTLKTIEQIDVLWLKGRAIKRAFEVEHTTSIYSGILRMADLLALQPNMDIRLHIVAPENRRDKVLQEIRRPVFSLLDRGPLSESCTFLPYDSVRKLGQQPHLAHLSDSVLDEYEEDAEDAG